MKRMAVVSLFPEMFAAITEYGVTARALRQGFWEMRCFNPRDYASDKRQTVDERPYGGGPGMVMSIEPLRSAIRVARNWAGGEAGNPAKVKVVYLSPQGQVLNHRGVVALGLCEGLVLIAGRYEGIDERLIELEVDEEWSIGDYVLSGGELPAMVLMDALVRQIPGALGHEDSAGEDSFARGLLDCPHYTRPEIYEDMAVPEVLLSGNHESIRRWRLRQALQRTRSRRPELLTTLALSDEERAMLKELAEGPNQESADDSEN